MRHAEVVEQVEDALIGIQQGHAGALSRRLGELQPESGKHAQKRAVQDGAFREVEYKLLITAVAQFVNERLEINAAIEAGTPANSHQGGLVHHGDLQGWAKSTHKIYFTLLNLRLRTTTGQAAQRGRGSPRRCLRADLRRKPANSFADAGGRGR